MPTPDFPVYASTVEVEDLGSLMELAPHAQPHRVLSWVRGGEGIIGWGRALEITTSGPGRFEDGARAWREVASTALVNDPVGLPGTGLVAFGTFTFSGDSALKSKLIVPDVLVGRRDGRAWITRVTLGYPGQVASGGAVNLPEIQPLLDLPGVELTPGVLAPEQWVEAVARVVERIRGGELSKVVMAREEIADADGEIDGRVILQRLAHDYPACWAFAVDGFMGATPELLVRLERGLVTCRVLAGTIQRTGIDSDDLVRAASLARSSKDLEEHDYAVASVERALRGYCGSVTVPDSPFVLHLPNVMHLASDVAGAISAPVTSLELASALHPTAAVGGTPTDHACRVLAGEERLDRGRYAGPVGWLDSSGDGEWGIGLRSAQFDATDPRRLRLYAGCGIVAASDPSQELAESEAKLAPVRGALGCI